MLIGAYKSHDQLRSAISNVRWDGKLEIVVEFLLFQRNSEKLRISFRHRFSYLKTVRKTMADDAEISKLPLEDRLVHKVKSFAPYFISN